MRGRVLAVAAAVALASAVPLAWPALLTAEEAGQYGWWYRLRSRALVNPLGVEATHPGVPPDGVLVAEDLDPDEPLAVAGFTYQAPEGPSATLELQVAPNTIVGFPQVSACPTTQAFFGEFPGRWEDRPAPNCDLSLAAGELLGDGEAMLFNLPSDFMVFPEFWNFVLVPDPQAEPFQIAFERPDASAFSVNEPAGLILEPPPPPPALPLVVPFQPRADVVEPDPPPDPEPVAALEPEQPRAQQPVAQPALPAATSDGSERVVAAAILALLAAGVGVMASADARPRPARASAGVVHGIGRFAKPRTGEPPRLA